jgi:regulator of sigma E protease
VLNKKDDGKVTEKAVYENYNKLKSMNQAYTRDEIIPKDVLVRLPETTPETPVHLSGNVLKSIELPPDNEIPLNEQQIKLRGEIKDKKYIISDGNLTLNDVAYAMSDGAKPLSIKVERGGQIVELKTVYPDEDGKIGVEYDNQKLLIPITGAGSAIKESSKYLYNETASMLVVLKQLFTGKIPLKNLHGVVLITKIGGDTIHHEGIFEGLLLIAMISMNLAIINFLPFPALDGGHFMFLLIEKITGRPLNEKAVNLVSNIGFILLILLMIFVVFNDIFYLAAHK